MTIEAPNSPQAPIDIIQDVLGGLDQEGAQLSIIPVEEEETTMLTWPTMSKSFTPSILVENPHANSTQPTPSRPAMNVTTN